MMRSAIRSAAIRGVVPAPVSGDAGGYILEHAAFGHLDKHREHSGVESLPRRLLCRIEEPCDARPVLGEFFVEALELLLRIFREVLWMKM